MRFEKNLALCLFLVLDLIVPVSTKTKSQGLISSDPSLHAMVPKGEKKKNRRLACIPSLLRYFEHERSRIDFGPPPAEKRSERLKVVRGGGGDL